MPWPEVQIRLLLANDRTFGPGKADLLDLIARHGSISAAARDMQMSYKRAWGLVEEVNAAFRDPLVITERGGAGHGGARITEAGQGILTQYRALQATLRTAGADPLQVISAALADPES